MHASKFDHRRRVSFVVGLLTAAILAIGSGPIHAGAGPQSDEKQAFEAAKELGTVEAWDAFLSNYPSGFHADLARAYVTKLAAPATAAPMPQQVYEYPMVAGTWGGIVRSGPGQDTAKVASLREGEEVTLLAPPIAVAANDYPWFKIAFRKGETGYMWGGLLCSAGSERPDLFKLCTFTPVRDTTDRRSAPERNAKPRASASIADQPPWCAHPGNATERAICGSSSLLSLDHVLNVAYHRAKFDSPDKQSEISHWQRRWIGQRNLCGQDARCIERRYSEQIQVLESYAGN
jgi:uncharacterized protein YecT (DUF1311 family)